MRISYKKLWIILLDREITKQQFRTDLNLATGTITKLNRNEDVSLSVLQRICEYLKCDIGDICGFITNNE